MNATVKFRKDAGLCIYCGDREPVPGMVGCDPCLEHRAEQTRAYYEKRVRTGICVRCKNSALEGEVFCLKHKELDQKSKRKK